MKPLTTFRSFLLFLGLMILVSACQSCASRANLDPNLVGVWQEIGSDDPLLLGLFPDGTFKAVFSSHRFETYHDYWGEWEASEGNLKLTITGGNQPPALSVYEGAYTINANGLQWDGILVEGSLDKHSLLFGYQGPPPSDGIIP